MARKPKKGLDYFPMDIDFFQDIKIRKLIKYQGGKAISVYAYLLCTIYKDGYYMRWDRELPFIVSEITGYDEAYIHEAIKSCVNIGLFYKELFENNQVLTSKGIQERFVNVMKNMNRVYEIDEFNLISCQETPISSEEMPISCQETPISSEFGTQRKRKETKLKEKKKDIGDFANPDQPSVEKINFVEIVELYHNLCPKLIRVRELSEKQKSYIRCRIKDFGIDKMKEAFTIAGQSDFLSGKNDRGYVADFEFLMKPEKFVNVLEGKYNNRKTYNNEKPAAHRASDPSVALAEGYMSL